MAMLGTKEGNDALFTALAAALVGDEDCLSALAVVQAECTANPATDVLLSIINNRHAHEDARHGIGAAAKGDRLASDYYGLLISYLSLLNADQLKALPERLFEGSTATGVIKVRSLATRETQEMLKAVYESINKIDRDLAKNFAVALFRGAARMDDLGAMDGFYRDYRDGVTREGVAVADLTSAVAIVQDSSFDDNGRRKLISLCYLRDRGADISGLPEAMRAAVDAVDKIATSPFLTFAQMPATLLPPGGIPAIRV